MFAATPPLHPKDHSQQANPDSAIAHAAAFRAVLLYTMVDTFDLIEEEVVWCGFQLDALLAPLAQLRPDSVPLPVRLEMVDGAYTRMMDARVSTGQLSGPTIASSAVTQASLGEWSDALISPILMSYNIPLAEQAKIQTGMTAMLSELGVGNEPGSRAATHIPKDMRSALSAAMPAAQAG